MASRSTIYYDDKVLIRSVSVSVSISDYYNISLSAISGCGNTTSVTTSEPDTLITTHVVMIIMPHISRGFSRKQDGGYTRLKTS